VVSTAGESADAIPRSISLPWIRDGDTLPISPRNEFDILSAADEVTLQDPNPPMMSPDLAPCDFFLFVYLKQRLEGKHITREDYVIAAVREVFDKIPLQTFQNVMADWQYQLRRCIQLGGEYFL
jgi:hypothetical protein